MAHYRCLGEVPPKRHTQHRDPEGRLYYEELMGEAMQGGPIMLSWQAVQAKLLQATSSKRTAIT